MNKLTAKDKYSDGDTGTNALSRRRFVKTITGIAATAPIVGLSAPLRAAEASGVKPWEGTIALPACGEWRQPGDDDFDTTIGKDRAEFLDRALAVIENEIVPKTQKGVRGGSKLFGAAVLNKSDLSTVIAATNTEADNPLLHGEITTINAFYALPKEQRPPVKETIFITTHEPCPLCLSGITWGGFDNFFYLFTYEDSKDAYGIPHDLVMLDEVFRCPDGTYSEKNKFWSSWSLRDLVPGTTPEQQAVFNKRIEALKLTYAEMSDIYQKAKAAGTGADVPLK